jgi:hypothetical protein
MLVPLLGDLNFLFLAAICEAGVIEYARITEEKERGRKAGC